ncbi:MAG: dihydrofolate reductase [Myxococcales bacterium]|nr:dihydrofolate reductase [Myxococcales bacterium]
MSARIRVFIASSLDGFIAGLDDDLSWLPGAEGDAVEDDHGYSAFMAQIGALLMGRRTYDVVRGFGGEWPYDKPVLIASHRPLDDAPPAVWPVSGSIEEIIAEARKAAGDRDVYIDGGVLIRAALDAGLIDEAIVTVIPIVLGAGVPLFAGATRRHPLRLIGSQAFGNGMVQLTYRPAPA